MSPSVPAVAPELTQAAAALARWRERAPVGARSPAARSSQAVALAATQGISKVAVTLRLDNTRLKRRVAAGGAPPLPPAAPPDFVALTLDLPARTLGCTLVLSHPTGPCLRLAWTDPFASEVATVARSLWAAVSRIGRRRRRGQQVLAARELAVLLAGGDWSAAAGVPPWRPVS